MTSRNAHEKKRFAKPPAGEDDRSIKGQNSAHKRRQASVYDAVAGRVTSTLPLIRADSQSVHDIRHHKRHASGSRRDPTLAPEEVLFKRAGAPIRYAEKDIYQAHEDLRDGGRDVLPDSDLLKSIHVYASHFYNQLPANRRTVHDDTGEGISERSMDETALIAFGMLLEEASRDALGKRGDLVFTEGVEIDEHGKPSFSHGEENEEARQTEAEAETAIEAESYGFNDALKYEDRGRLKRRRTSTIG
ncbi:hypothetical protein GGS20DRAFT_240189 [Poronia punctata]|nr:hypothetical protein GGS20DRAFT_240189 [Poronia punctata]